MCFASLMALAQPGAAVSTASSQCVPAPRSDTEVGQRDGTGTVAEDADSVLDAK